MACPSLEEINGILQEEDDSCRFRNFMAHLDKCSRCQEALRQLSALPLDQEDEVIFSPTGDEKTLYDFESPAGAFLIAPQDKATKIGSLRIIRKIGEGGMAEVFECVDERVGRNVAVKRINTNVISSRNLDRLRQEARIHARLKHPNIVPLLEFDLDEGLPYLVMELVEGGTLRDLFKKGRVKPRQLAEIIRDVALGLQAAHDLNILHRDLKPANILLESVPRSGSSDSKFSDTKTAIIPKVSDFGLAKLVEIESDLSASAMFLGTPSYMSPEQTFGDSQVIDKSADIYSLGVILYEGLTGSLPFVGEDVTELFAKIRGQSPIPPTEFQSGVPVDLEIICLKCLEKDKRSRYASASALADDLDRFLQDKPIAARPVGPIGQLIRWSRRKPVMAASLSLLLFEGFFFGVGGIYIANREYMARTAVEKDKSLVIANRDQLRGEYRKLRSMYQFGIDLMHENAEELKTIIEQGADTTSLKQFQKKLLNQRGEMAERIVNELDLTGELGDLLVEAYYLYAMKLGREMQPVKAAEYYDRAVTSADEIAANGALKDITRYFAIRSLNELALYEIADGHYESACSFLCKAWENYCCRGDSYVVERSVKQLSMQTAYLLIDCLSNLGRFDEISRIELFLADLEQVPLVFGQDEVPSLR